jgi:uncharacterized protein (TIGR02594 family)
MTKMGITAYELAQRFVGTKEVRGTSDSPLILAMLRLDGGWPDHDEVPWCSAFVNYIAWLLRLPRSKSLAARSWLDVGTPIWLQDAEVGFDVVVFDRGANPAAGHVGFFGGLFTDGVMALGGNQGNMVSVRLFPRTRVIGVRRLWTP